MNNCPYQVAMRTGRIFRALSGIVLGIALFSLESSAQTQAAQQSPPTIGDTLEKTVGFITVPYKAGDKINFVRGTCFFVAVPDDRLGKGASFIYTVTNRHVATAEGVDPSLLLPVVLIEVNLSNSNGGSAIYQDEIALTATTHWYYPSDVTIDLAILPTVPKPELFDVQGIPVSFFATDDVMKSERVGIGDSVFFIGFFSQFPGKERLEPVYRHGEIAMMPVDTIEMSDGPGGKIKTQEHLYLADAHAFHGNSGSPLFVQIGGFRNGTMSLGSFPYRLIGVVNGFIPERSDVQVTGAATLESSNEPNSGILTFVPTQELKDLLDSPKLKKLRDDAVAVMGKH